MRLISAAALAVMLGGAAKAECPKGSADAGMTVTGWATGDASYSGANVIVSLENSSPQTINAIEGYILFADPLGRALPPVGLPSIEVIPTGPFETYALGVTGRALSELPADQFTWAVCVQKIAYADGTVQDFTQ